MLDKNQINALKALICHQSEFGNFLSNNIEKPWSNIDLDDMHNYIVANGGRKRIPKPLAIILITAIELSSGSRNSMEWLREFLKKNGEFHQFLKSKRINAFYRPSVVPDEKPDNNEWVRTLKRDLWRIVVSNPVGPIIKKLSDQHKKVMDFFIENEITPKKDFIKAIGRCNSRQEFDDYINHLQNKWTTITKPEHDFYKKNYPDFLESDIKGIRLSD
ncbi:MAG: hypothetical protein H6622_08415 [Halobacteriovoraceae bacterium]|nr:hypothetical protein [Halobacteriovoraceae bacterium]